MPTAPEEMTLKVIAHIHTAFPTKFGIPRQSGLVDELRGRGDLYARIPQCRCRARSGRFQPHLAGVAVFRRGAGQLVPPPVRPPALGRQHPHGRVRHPVALPPQPLGLSSVRLEASSTAGRGPGAHRARCRPDGRHPHLRHQASHIPYADCHPDAAEGFTGQTQLHHLEVARRLLAQVPETDRAALTGVLAGDPRPSYQHDPQRVYGMEFGRAGSAFYRGRCSAHRDGIARR